MYPENRKQARRQETASSMKLRSAKIVKALIEIYPAQTIALKNHHAMVCRHIDAELAGEEEPLTVSAERRKQEYWELLKIIAEVDPDLPIVELHDEESAKMDARVIEAQSNIADIDRSTLMWKDHMRNVLIALHVGGKTAADQEHREFLQNLED